MNFVLQSRERTLVSLGNDELLAISNALNEVCNGVAITEPEFQTRLGVSRDFVDTLLRSLSGEVNVSQQGYAATEVWADQSSVMVRVITAFGDPVEMGETEAAEFAGQLLQAVEQVSGSNGHPTLPS